MTKSLAKYINTSAIAFLIVSNLYAQVTETKDFSQKKYKTFVSVGHPKNRGLFFSIKYPSSYSTFEVENENVVKGFAHVSYNLVYMVGAVKSPTKITIDNQDLLLSEDNLKKSVTTITNNKIFLAYKNRFKINGMPSAYLEFMINGTQNDKIYMRQYFIVYKNYFLTISFSVMQKHARTLESTKALFDSYKSFFNLASNTLIVIK